ncbi:alpha/beta fold hydrolase [Bacteroides graminisolvens]|uniref:alpha/beta fold hydrolase n=1 Tax=Bacteroides graminisolvens TaxID=477666 RepID=UPI000405ABF9|nr:alpha/beta hydrolase [Bacteroides graminisolvens]
MNIYRKGGDKLEAIIFFNPMGTNKDFWSSLIPAELYDKYEIILFDYPGFSSDFVNQNTLHDTSEMVRNELLIHLDKPFVFCGYSYGGMVVQELLKESYANLRSVILISSQNKLTFYDKEINKILYHAISMDELLFCRFLTILSYDPFFINKNNLFYIKLFANLKFSPCSSAAIAQQLKQMSIIDKIDFPVLDIPALYIYGENDRMLKINSVSEISKLLPKIEIKKLPESSHILDGKLLSENILGFLNN